MLWMNLVHVEIVTFSISRTFAASICGKIAKMISVIATPVDMKLKLIPILRHMHHDIATSTKVFLVFQRIKQEIMQQSDKKQCIIWLNSIN